MDDYIAQATSARARVTHVITHVRRVLAKYPRSTVDAKLLAVFAAGDMAYRLSDVQPGVIVYTWQMWAGKPTTLRFPVSLLNAQESEIHVWARAQYWDGVHRARRAEAGQREAKRAQLVKNLERASVALEKFERDRFSSVR